MDGELGAIEDARAADRSELGNAAQLSTMVDGGPSRELPGELPLPNLHALAGLQPAVCLPSFHRFQVRSDSWTLALKSLSTLNFSHRDSRSFGTPQSN